MPRVKFSYTPHLMTDSKLRANFLYQNHLHRHLPSHFHPTSSDHHIPIPNMSTANKFRFNKQCVCGKKECFLVQTQLCELVSLATTGDAGGAANPAATDVWCQPRPFSIFFHPIKSNYRTWLLLLSVVHHVPGFITKFLDAITEFDTKTSMVGGRTKPKQFFINRIHFPRALLQNREHFGLSQNQTLMPAPLANHLADLDDNKKRMVERVNTVAYLGKLAKRILRRNAALLHFQRTKTEEQLDENYYVQAPVEVLHEAKLLLAALSTFPSKLSINRRQLLPPPPTLPKRKRLACEVTESSKKTKLVHNQHDPLQFIDSIVTNTVRSPSRAARPPGELLSSPIRDITFIESCRANIQLGFHRKSFNFYNSLKAYRQHHSQTEPVKIEDGWLYPCTNGNCTSNGFLYIPKKKVRSDQKQLCSVCNSMTKKVSRNDNDRKKRSATITRISPITAMKDEEKAHEYKSKQVQVQRLKESNNRLREQLQRKSKIVTLRNVCEASSLIKTVHEFLVSKKVDAIKVLLDAVIDMETSTRIKGEDEQQRREYVDFIASDILNTCKSFDGKTSQIRFHPVMINLAMNLYMGMRYEDTVDTSAFVFPTVKTLQRHRARVATHEGTDPKVYARVSEMEGFKREQEMLVHWMFDEVKLTSGVMWNATNDDLRGLCCGTTGDVEDLKDLLEDLYDTTSNDDTSNTDEGRDGIYCNQWLARNAFGTTLVGEFFYNEGNLDGNEMMRQFLQVTTSAAIANLTTIGLVSDMGGANDRFYHHLRNGESIPATLLWPTNHVSCISPVDPSVKLHTWCCSTHGLKNVRSQIQMSRQDGSGSRQFITANGDDFGWWTVWDAFCRDKERELKKGGNFRTTLTAQAVDLDSYSKMNASLAKQPFTDKTLASIMSNCAEVVGDKKLKRRMVRVKSTKRYKSAGSGDKLRIHLKFLQDLPPEKKKPIAGDLAYLEFGVSVHSIYIQRFMNKHWGISLQNIDAEEERVKECLMYFERWRLSTLEYKVDDVRITRKIRERFFLSTQTYRNMKFGLCGFFQYAREILNHPSGRIKYVNSGHSNTSALESRFSIAKRAQLNDTAKYQHAAANANSIATYKHKREAEKRRAKKTKKGNKSYPGELITPELPECAATDFTVGQVLKRRKEKVDCLLMKVLLTSHGWEKPPTETILQCSLRHRPLTRVCKEILPILQKQRIKEGNFCEMLRKDETIRDLMVLTIESPVHWGSMEMLLSESGSLQMEKECIYLVEVAFELLDKAVAAVKLSPKSSFWWQVMQHMRDESVHQNSPNRIISNHIRSYLFLQLSGRLMSWSRGALGGREEQKLAKYKLQDIPGDVIDYTTIATDVNTFVGFSLFSLKKKYGDFEKLTIGKDQEDKFWLLTDIAATEEDIKDNNEYCSKYYDSYYVILNRGDMTIVSPRYVDLFHQILFQISRNLNVVKMIENQNNFLENARANVERNLPAWSKEFQRRAEGVFMVDPEKASYVVVVVILAASPQNLP